MKEEYKWESDEAARAGPHTDTLEPGAQASHIEHEVLEEPVSVVRTQAGPIGHVVMEELGEHEPGCGVSAWARLHTDTQEPGAQAGHVEHEVMEEPEIVTRTQAGPIEHEVMEELGEHEQACGVSAWAGLRTDTQEPGAQAGRIDHEVKVEPREHEQGTWAGLHTDTQKPGAQAGHIEHKVKIEPMEHEEGACDVSALAGLHTDAQEPGVQAGHIEHEVKVEPVEHEEGACGVSAWAWLHTDTQEAGAQAGHIEQKVMEELESVAGTEADHIEHEVKVEPMAHVESAAAALAALYQDHRVKKELVVGPKQLHWSKVGLVHPERGAVAGSACSVRLEHMRVDLERCACRIGRHTYKLRSCLNSQRDSYTRKKTNMSKNKISRQRENRRRDRKIKSSIGKDNIKNHEKVHTGEKPYKCEHCSCSNVRKSHLKCHEMTHSGGKLYKCTQCSYTASVYKSAVKNNETTHTGEKPYKCTYCRYSTIYKLHLEAHENTHTGEQPYKCVQFSYFSARKGQVSALPFIQYSPHHKVCSSKSDATTSGFISEEEEVDVVSLGTSELPLATTHERTDSLLRVPSAQERQHTQRTVASAMSPRPAACKCMLPRRRGRRSYTDTDSEAEAPETERRSIHNAKERLRRTGLRNLFDKLQEQIPVTSINGRAPKIFILREAASLCRRLRQEDIERECLRKRQNKLLTKLKKLRTIVASIWF